MCGHYSRSRRERRRTVATTSDARGHECREQRPMQEPQPTIRDRMSLEGGVRPSQDRRLAVVRWRAYVNTPASQVQDCPYCTPFSKREVGAPTQPTAKAKLDTVTCALPERPAFHASALCSPEPLDRPSYSILPVIALWVVKVQR